MGSVTRRSVLRGSLGLVAAGALGCPYIANAAATTATVWWTQGFVPDEDAAFRKLVADYEKASGNKLDYSIVPFAPLRQKEVSAVTSGVVPDVMEDADLEFAALTAWQDQLLDLSDVVETQMSRYSEIALLSRQLYDNRTKERHFYGVPMKTFATPFHIWGDLIEKAGFKMSDIPTTWDKFIDFFVPVQKELQGKGMRHTYASGFVVSTIGNDPLNTFHAFMIAYGGKDLVLPDGKLNAHDPKVREAVIKALTKLSTFFKEGHIPPGSVNWNDADDNNAFHSKLCVMDFDGTLSTELAMIHDEQAYYHDMITWPLPRDNDGNEIPSQFGVNNAIIPAGAKNVDVAKEFAKYLITPKVNNDYLKHALGRWLPVFPSLAKEDPWWTDPKDPHRAPYVKQGLDSPTVPFFFNYNPAYAQCRTEHIFNVAWADIVHGSMSVEAAADKAFKRAETIFGKYVIQQG